MSARTPQPRRTRLKRLHDYFFPHPRNAYRPNFFSFRSVGMVALGLIILQAIYFAQTKLVFEHTDFLAAVLPSVLTDLTNEDRTQEGLTKLAPDPQLTRAAQLAANDMAQKGYFAHNSPDGKTPWYWLDQISYEYSYSGQNLAVNFTDSKDVEQAWLDSPTHRANIMKGEYTHIGIAVAQGIYRGDRATFVVQYFATPKRVAVPAPIAVMPSTSLSISAEASPPAGSEVLSAASEPHSPTLGQEASTQNHDKATALDPEQLAIDIVEEPVSIVAQAATSPHASLLYLLSFLAALVTVLLAVAIATHLRVQYVEVMGGGLALLLLTLSFLAFHTFAAPNVTLPADGSDSYVEASTL